MKRYRLLAAATCLVVAAAFALPVHAQAIIKVNDNINFKLGLLLQPQADFQQLNNAAGNSIGYQDNLMLRRARFLIGGQVAKDVFFFAETENSRLGQATATAGKNLGTGFFLLDAMGEWRVSKQFNLQAGLIRVPVSREALKQAGSEFEIDFSAYTFGLASATQSNSGGRDTGVMVRGYFLNDHLEYRAGGFQGMREVNGRTAFRGTGRLQYNFFDTEVYNFPSYLGSFLGTKKILAVGAAYDFQRDYYQGSGDVFWAIPIPGGSVEGSVQFVHIDGGLTFPTALPQQNTFQAEAGYYCKTFKSAAWARYEQKHLTGDFTKNEQRYGGGLNYYFYGHTFNLKAGYFRVIPETGNGTNEFILQFQVYYF